MTRVLDKKKVVQDDHIHQHQPMIVIVSKYI